MKSKVLIIITPLMFLCLAAVTPDSIEPEKMLFKIERSKDANTICYLINKSTEGTLEEEPISAFWIKKTKRGKIEPLTWIQKKYAYGLKYLSRGVDVATFQFVCYDKQNFILKKINDEYHVFTKKEDHILEVKRIFVQIDGGTFWFPKVPEIKLYAHDLNLDEDIVQVVKP